MPLEVNLEMEEAWYFSLFQSYTDEVILELQWKQRRLDCASNWDGTQRNKENNAVKKTHIKIYS